MSAKKSATGGREPQRYDIRVRGPIGPTMMQAFPTLTASSRGQDTILTGSLPDQCVLYGIINQLEALGLELLEIRPLPPSHGRPLATQARSHSNAAQAAPTAASATASVSVSVRGRG
ncbi:hypothetical protein E0H73_42185 [Kribbella pittospori]|uniref:Uncharacterized protein n=1 Tax=Kribbella pittospori TaxID=722689 RepID=A0A4R0JRP2_9ACTN|nr:hypothetical protein [Kribbella pittospori]TCC49559.1 hypothetical protein E0H73_42185 [Kribbella pittospori]